MIVTYYVRFVLKVKITTVTFQSITSLLHLVAVLSRWTLRAGWTRKTNRTLDAVTTGGTHGTFLSLGNSSHSLRSVTLPAVKSTFSLNLCSSRTEVCVTERKLDRNTHRTTLFSSRARWSLRAIASCQTDGASRTGSTSLSRGTLSPKHKNPSVIDALSGS